MSLVAAFATGTMAWEIVNPVSHTQRGVIFGFGLGVLLVIVALFVFELFVADRGWCGHLCPMGAFYSILGRVSRIRVRADKRALCNDCGDCYAVCPEPRVIKPALNGSNPAASCVILSPNCTNCGRCIDVCPKDVFRFGTLNDRSAGRHPRAAKADTGNETAEAIAGFRRS